MNDELRQQIVSALGIDVLDQDQQDAVIADAGELILNQIVLDAYDALPDASKTSFKEAGSAGNLEKVFQILEENTPDYEAIIDKASKNVIASMTS